MMKRYIPAWLAVLMVAAAPAAENDSSFDTHTLEYGQATIAVHIEEKGDMGVGTQQILRWIDRAADAMITYYGRFPVDNVEIAVGVSQKGKINGGTAYGADQIIMELGPDTTPKDLDEDWRLTHEMVHVCFPSLDRRHTWMMEGVATYVESIARVRAGQMPPETVWWWMVTGLPKGLPEAGDQGLDRTHTWGRIYWGGALYFFLADMQIRLETDNRRSLDDALRGIVDAGGDGGARWPITKVTATGDRATGTTVMTDLYEKMSETPLTPDLQDWFRRLGVRYQNDEITLDNQAPLSHIRRAVTRAPAS